MSSPTRGSAARRGSNSRPRSLLAPVTPTLSFLAARGMCGDADSPVRFVLPAVLIAVSAFAHDADVIYVELQNGGSGDLLEVVTLTAASLAMLAPVDADGNGELTQSDLDARTDALKFGVWEQARLSSESGACVRSA